MSTKSQAFHTNRSLRFTVPSGEDLPADTAWFWRGDTATMHVLVAWQHWERIAREQLFNLEEDDIPTDLIPDVNVLIEAQLRTGEVTFPTDVKTLRMRLANPTDPLSQTENWTATQVRQQPPLPDEEDLTESVFDEDDEPRPHTYEFTISRRTRPKPPETGETSDEDDGTAIPIETKDENGGATDVGGEPTGTDDEATSSGGGGSIDASDFMDGEMNAPTGSDTDLAPVLEPVVETLEQQGWTHKVNEDGSQISLRASFENHEWPVFIRPGEKKGWCRITSVHPVEIRDARRDELATDLLSYNGTIDRGGFEIDEETGSVRFNTPFVSQEESVSDAIGENVTAMAEWYERIAP